MTDAEPLEPSAPSTPSDPSPSSVSDKPWGMENNTFCMLLHLAQFGGYLIPGAGLILPIVMWVMNKDRFPDVDKHGKVVVNWIISCLIYGLVSALLVFVGIGVILLGVLGILGIIFPIVGGVKANNGEVWPYPMSIKFFK